FGVVTRVAIPPAMWLALTLLLYGARTISVVPGLPILWFALYLALAIGQRDILPMPGPAYYAIVAFNTTSAALPFVIDRFGTATLNGLSSTLIFPATWVAVEFLRSRFTPSASWGSIAYTQYGYLP